MFISRKKYNASVERHSKMLHELSESKTYVVEKARHDLAVLEKLNDRLLKENAELKARCRELEDRNNARN